jgi:hypothetical protein
MTFFSIILWHLGTKVSKIILDLDCNKIVIMETGLFNTRIKEHTFLISSVNCYFYKHLGPRGSITKFKIETNDGVYFDIGIGEWSRKDLNEIIKKVNKSKE